MYPFFWEYLTLIWPCAMIVVVGSGRSSLSIPQVLELLPVEAVITYYSVPGPAKITGNPYLKFLEGRDE